MYFPIADVFIDPLYLLAIGFLVGVLGGFFGVGGGFIASPMMFLAGVPMNFVVGTDLAHMTGKSIVAAKRHRTLGHVDFKLGLVMVLATIPGVELGARIVEELQRIGMVDQVIGITYIVILLVIGAFTAWESLQAMRMVRIQRLDAQDAVAFRNITQRMHRIQLWPMVSFPASGIGAISLWVVLGVGFISGVLAGTLGVGGGFIRMPLLVYVVGMPTHVAIGTDLFEIVISASYGTLTHAVKGNVDIMIALVMGTGGAIGAQIGAVSTNYFAGPRIRLLFSILPLFGALLMAAQLLGINMPGL
ncbi:MAG: sulfite exporter TauE/SafE family protein [Chloroflexota bacterium]|nr:sulfite exporter TauE/SafE family protein [Chloroflexota bacterium]